MKYNNRNNNTNNKSSNSLNVLNIPPCSMEFYKGLCNLIKPIKVTALTPVEVIKWNAAQLEVLDIIKKYAMGRSISGDGREIKDTEHPDSMLSRLGVE